MTDAESKQQPPERRSIPALRVNQWRAGWENVGFSEKAHRRKPEPSFLLCSIPAVELKSLCGVSRRDATNPTPRAQDLGIQRQHDEKRSEEISRYIEYGFPWSTLSDAQRRSNAYNSMRKPGWLPTAIVVNILRDIDRRPLGGSVAAEDLIQIEDAGAIASLKLPYSAWVPSWRPSNLPPMEIVDGQHRLFAFGGQNTSFELPVVAFYGLDISWQAYLFWTINIKPKRINASLAFDLYPLLRGEDWLDSTDGHPVYRETRAQELTEAMWSHPDSPWLHRINMLGQKDTGGVTQSAWIKTLTATFVRQWRSRGSKLGGLFGGRYDDDDEVLGWSRAQQAAFLIYAARALHRAITNTNADWAQDLRQSSVAKNKSDDAAFYGPYALINTDQGVRGFLHVLNDLCFASASRLALDKWAADEAAGAADETAVSNALRGISEQKIAGVLDDIAKNLATFDWRSSAAPNLSEEQRLAKLAYRGSGGYLELRRRILEHLVSSSSTLKSMVERVEALA
ncbi:DGQHR domain-containing protein [Vitreimonas flagellata]|uniref:DGQHR domain-containing protein n=1 Tax=Vitreimonas flagellata TaxID=2560861 RepID=UPI001074C99E|nr:DGQHR domain-containing protein [Vitreimonas flagellata]